MINLSGYSIIVLFACNILRPKDPRQVNHTIHHSYDESPEDVLLPRIQDADTLTKHFHYIQGHPPKLCVTYIHPKHGLVV